MQSEAIQAQAVKELCTLELDATGLMQWGDRQTNLSPAEARMVHELLSRRSTVVSRHELAMRAVTEVRRGLDAHIYRLRQKLSVFYNLELETVPKRGFRLNIREGVPLDLAG